MVAVHVPLAFSGDVLVKVFRHVGGEEILVLDNVVHAGRAHHVMQVLVPKNLVRDRTEQASAILVHLLDFEAQLGEQATRKQSVSLLTNMAICKKLIEFPNNNNRTIQENYQYSETFHNRTPITELCIRLLEVVSYIYAYIRGIKNDPVVDKKYPIVGRKYAFQEVPLCVYLQWNIPNYMLRIII